MSFRDIADDDLRKLRSEANERALEPARLLPLLSDAELFDLADDILANGQSEPILVDKDGWIVDGRNRWIACKGLGIAPKSVPVDPSADPVIVAISRNIHRRHLTTSQRAALAADLCNLKRGGKQPDSPLAISQAKAAMALKVSPRHARTAASIKQRDPELHEKIKEGEVTVHAAQRLLAGVKDERIQVPARKVARSATAEPASATAYPARYATLFTELDELPATWEADPLPRDAVVTLRASLAAALALVDAALARQSGEAPHAAPV